LKNTERWSIHPIILEDESICSWMKRLSQEFNNSLAIVLNKKRTRHTNYYEIDIDPPRELVEHLSKRTGVSIQKIKSHSIKAYDTKFPSFTTKEGLVRKGVLAAKKKSPQLIRKLDFFCPLCLKEGTPYFRWFWKLGFYFVCHVHSVFMVSKCEICNKQIKLMLDHSDIQFCIYCKFDLRNTKPQLTNSFGNDYDFIAKIAQNFLSEKSIHSIEITKFIGFLWQYYKLATKREDNNSDLLVSSKYPKLIKNDGIVRNLDILVLKVINELLQDSKNDLEKLLPCVYCDEYTFYRNDSYSSHLVSHSNTRVYPCPQCDLSFKRKSTLEDHQQTHSDERPYICEKCGKSFKRKTMLNRHRLTHNEPLLECLHCSKKFNRNDSLESHIERVHLKVKNFTCEVEDCGMQFYSSIELSEHKDVHLDYKKHICKICNKKFQTPRGLRGHKLVHTEERPFPCDYENCDYRAKSESRLKTHKLNAHVNVQNKWE